MVQNPQLQMSLDTAVAEVLGLLSGLDLQYKPEEDRYQAITRAINRAQRAVALEHEWSWFADTASVGPAVYGEREVVLASSLRPRIINDDAVRLCNDEGEPVFWAYFLPRDALHKYIGHADLHCSVLRDRLSFSRNFSRVEDGLDIQVPVMREPLNFVLPQQPEDPNAALIPVPDATRNQLIDFWYPDMVVAKAATFYAMTDPIMQPRVQTLEAQYKDLLYQVIERDDRFTDSPEQNTWLLPVESSLRGDRTFHRHPIADRNPFH